MVLNPNIEPTRMEKISELLLEEVAERFDLDTRECWNDCIDIEFSESFAELLDKFLVLHIRMWRLEDAIGEATSDKEVADLKRKVDICFKEKRPKLTAAINTYLDVYVIEGRPFAEESVKLYKGYDS